MYPISVSLSCKIGSIVLLKLVPHCFVQEGNCNGV